MTTWIPITGIGIVNLATVRIVKPKSDGNYNLDFIGGISVALTPAQFNELDRETIGFRIMKEGTLAKIRHPVAQTQTAPIRTAPVTAVRIDPAFANLMH